MQGFKEQAVLEEGKICLSLPLFIVVQYFLGGELVNVESFISGVRGFRQ